MKFTDLILTFYKGLFFGRMHKGYRYFFGKKGIYPILKGSSICCNELLRLVRYKSPLLMKIKPFILDDMIAFNYDPLLKGKYNNYNLFKNDSRNDNRGKVSRESYYEIVK